MPAYVWLSVLSGIACAIYINSDSTILHRRFAGMAFNYTIFSYGAGALFTLVVTLLFQQVPGALPWFERVQWPPAEAWPYLVATALLNGVSASVYFLILLHSLGAVYHGTLGQLKLIYVLALSVLPGPFGLGEALTPLQVALIMLTLGGVVLTGYSRGDQQATQREVLFLVVVIMIGLNLPNALIEVLGKRVLALGVIDPPNYRVWYFLCAAIGVTALTPLIARLPVARPDLLRGLGVPINQIDVPSLHTLRRQATAGTVALNMLAMHGFVFVSHLAYCYAQYGLWSGPLSLINPVRSATTTLVVWLVQIVLVAVRPVFLARTPQSLSCYLRTHRLRLVGTVWATAGLVALSLTLPQ